MVKKAKHEATVAPVEAEPTEAKKERPQRAVKGKFGEGQVITLLVTANPKRGKKCTPRFDLYRDGMTVGEYIAAQKEQLGRRAGDAMGDIRWDVYHKFIKVD